ncbi:hypothetical protein [Parendozoicomonas sp. Alg238-R29]|uniref:hypothetical protein n=1 Tax=Parendozoicomonas sp. Alg238-R29 TaxID=2993446 RepID=UPI00248DD5B5|nr:hypothetical protein [Parendozoicomonas sp. Alg238-R29]
MYWNKHIEEGHLQSSKKFLTQFCRSLSEYNVKRADEVEGAREFCELLIRKRVRHDESCEQPPSFDAFITLYGYIPGNIFIGPTGANVPFCRSDDPGNRFEENAWVVTGFGPYKFLFDLDNMITGYVQRPSTELSARISNALTTLVQVKDPYRLNPKDWLLKKGNFSINVSDYIAEQCCSSPRQERELKRLREFSSPRRERPASGLGLRYSSKSSTGPDSSLSDSSRESSPIVSPAVSPAGSLKGRKKKSQGSLMLARYTSVR